MRISDWSSDVCSSDLRAGLRLDQPAQCALLRQRLVRRIACRPGGGLRPESSLLGHQCEQRLRSFTDQGHGLGLRNGRRQLSRGPEPQRADIDQTDQNRAAQKSENETEGPIQPANRTVPNTRSEEHTSELQSLMRISYAVF